MIVFMLPLAELLGELGRGPEGHAPVELVFVRPMAALDLSIGLGVAPRNLPVDDPEIPQVPGEVGPNGLVGCATVLEGRATTPSRRPYPGRGQLSSPQFVREDPLAHAGRSTTMKWLSRIGAIRGFTSSHFNCPLPQPGRTR